MKETQEILSGDRYASNNEFNSKYMITCIPVYIRNNKSYINDIVSVYGPKQLIRSETFDSDSSVTLEFPYIILKTYGLKKSREKCNL